MKMSRPFDAFQDHPPGPRRRPWLDALAWILFGGGVVAMIGVAFVALLGEGDGDVRTWDTIRRQVRILWAAGTFAIVGPMVVWLVQQWLNHRDGTTDPEKSQPPNQLER